MTDQLPARENIPLVLDADLAALLSDKIQFLFQSTFNFKTQVGDYKISSPYSSDGDIYACVTMVQKDIEGTLIMSFTKEVALNLASEVYRRNISEVDDTVRDAVGEISNIIYASVKKVLNEKKGHSFQLSIPKVFLKNDLKNQASFIGRTLVIPINLSLGAFEVFITIEKNTNGII